MIGWAIRGHEASETLPDSYFLPLLLLQVGAGLQSCVKSPSRWRVDCCSSTASWDIKADLDISHFLSCIVSYLTLFWGHSFTTLLENMQAWCSRMWPGVLTPLFFTAYTSPSPSPLAKGQGYGTLISQYPLHSFDCPTLTPPHLPVFALALHRTSVTAPATVACSLPSPIPPEAC